MIEQNKLSLPKPPFFILLIIVMASCDKFSGDQTVPAYISIDSIALKINDLAKEGSASNAITDAWVYLDGESVGTFQLPARFPVLKEGKHTIMIKPGIKKDGIAATRIVYDFYSPLQQTVSLLPDSSISLGTWTSSYVNTTIFLWKENFEDVAISLDTSNRSTVPIINTPLGSPLAFEGKYSGMAALNADTDFFECSTHKEYDVPANAVFLEMNFRSNNTLLVGVFVYMDAYIYQVPIITLFPTHDIWKKIYIDLTTSLNAYIGAKKFKVYFSTFKNPDVSAALILLDNLKLVTR